MLDNYLEHDRKNYRLPAEAIMIRVVAVHHTGITDKIEFKYSYEEEAKRLFDNMCNSNYLYVAYMFVDSGQWTLVNQYCRDYIILMDMNKENLR